jgi:putative transposase
MPEHVHLLLSEPLPSGAPLKPSFGLSGAFTLADALKSLNQGISRRLIGKKEHFWSKRYYDFNIRNHQQFVEKLRYIHRNPVERGLCERPEDWEWSSFRQYATGCAGRVEMECEGTARNREREAGTICSAIELPHSSQKRA